MENSKQKGKKRFEVEVIFKDESDREYYYTYSQAFCRILFTKKYVF